MGVEPLAAMFVLGAAGGLHCLGMCGGIAAALAGTTAGSRPTAILLGYNIGRIATYTVAGMIVGSLGSTIAYASLFLQPQRAMYVLMSLALVVSGLHLAEMTRLLGFAERAGSALWRHVQPLTHGLLPASTPLRGLAAGAVWGWIPCGLVYSALVPAMASGSPVRGAAMMMAFGAGTLPSLLASGLFAARLARWRQGRHARAVLGLIVASLGVLGLLHMMHASGLIEQAIAVCFGSRQP